MVDCSCYHDEKNFLGKRGVCWGTKEREACSCGGDASKCDFYPEKKSFVLDKRKAFKFEMDDDEAQIQVIKDAKKYGFAIMKLKTNYAKIHALDEEGLAAFLAIITTGDRSDRARWLKWLKQEANE